MDTQQTTTTAAQTKNPYKQARQEEKSKSKGLIFLKLSKSQVYDLASFLNGYLETDTARENNPDITKILKKLSIARANKKVIVWKFGKRSFIITKDCIKF